VNEVILVLLLAARYGVPVCPHAGGVGLSELVQHLAAFDYVCLGGALEDRMVEYVDELHEHFVDPVTVSGGRYRLPATAGYSTTMHSQSLTAYSFPDGQIWRLRAGDRAVEGAKDDGR
jgi:L-fuconate dehydratase